MKIRTVSRAYATSVAKGLSFCLWASLAKADPLAQVTIRLDAPPECPSHVALQAELRRDLEGSQVPAERLDVVARIRDLGAGQWQAEVLAQSDGGTSERVLLARNCQALVDATSLIVAIIIDPETATNHARSLEAVTVAPAPTASLTETPAPPVLAPPATVATTSKPRGHVVLHHVENASRHPLGGIVAAWAGLDHGSLPSTTAAFGGAVGLSYGAWRAETSFSWWLPQNELLGGSGPHAASNATFGMFAGAARLCLRIWRREPMAVSPCAGMAAAYRSGAAPGLTEPQTARRWDGAAAAALLGTWSISESLGFRLDLEVGFPLYRPAFGFYDQDGPHEVFRPANITWRGAGGFEWRFR